MTGEPSHPLSSTIQPGPGVDTRQPHHPNTVRFTSSGVYSGRLEMSHFDVVSIQPFLENTNGPSSVLTRAQLQQPGRIFFQLLNM